MIVPIVFIWYSFEYMQRKTRSFGCAWLPNYVEKNVNQLIFTNFRVQVNQWRQCTLHGRCRNLEKQSRPESWLNDVVLFLVNRNEKEESLLSFVGKNRSLAKWIVYGLLLADNFTCFITSFVLLENKRDLKMLIPIFYFAKLCQMRRKRSSSNEYQVFEKSLAELT